jgi:hypothetical protein
VYYHNADASARRGSRAQLLRAEQESLSAGEARGMAAALGDDEMVEVRVSLALDGMALAADGRDFSRSMLVHANQALVEIFHSFYRVLQVRRRETLE